MRVRSRCRFRLDGMTARQAGRARRGAGAGHAGASPQLVARTGDPAPGAAAGANYASFGDHAFNDAGQVAYGAVLTGTGVTTENDSSLYAGSFAAPQLVARGCRGELTTSSGLVRACTGASKSSVSSR